MIHLGREFIQHLPEYAVSLGAGMNGKNTNPPRGVQYRVGRCWIYSNIY